MSQIAKPGTSSESVPSVDENLTIPSAPCAKDEVFGAKDIRFDLSALYAGLDDPQLDEDLLRLESMYTAFDEKYRGQLSHALADALRDLEALTVLQWKLETFIALTKSCDVTNQNVRRVESRVAERLQKASAQHFTFFEHEIIRLNEDVLSSQIVASAYLSARWPYLDHIRAEKDHYLDELIERALVRRASVGPISLVELYEEAAGAARFSIPCGEHAAIEMGREGLTMEEILDILSSDPDRDVRRAALTGLNDGLRAHLGLVATATLNGVIGEHLIECDERKYAHPMAPRNLENRVEDAVVDALHVAVKKVGPLFTQRYYSLLARALELPTPLAWSDRNASVDPVKTVIPWDEGVKIVRDAYESFSPTLASLFDEVLARGDVDAAMVPAKESGAFCWATVLPEPHGVRAFVFLNYSGTPDGVETLAHEMGHAVHGLLAGKSQGPLLQDAPMAFAETASTFGEYVTFEHLLEKLSSHEERFKMLMGKAVRALNTVVRQVSFSCFEQEVHARRAEGKLTTEQFSQIWLDVCHQFYGKEGETFTFQDTDLLWSYVSHFHSPFYVYSYAFGDLLTAALHSRGLELGAGFEALYLDLLRAGSTKDIVTLLEPFGLNPRDPSFWERAMEEGIGRILSEAEQVFSLMQARRAAPTPLPPPS